MSSLSPLNDIFFRKRKALYNGKKRRERLHGKRSSRNKDGTDLSDLPLPPPRERVCMKTMTDNEKSSHCRERRKKWMTDMHPQKKRRMKEREAAYHATYNAQRKTAKTGGSPILLCCSLLIFAIYNFHVNIFRYHLI